jgi:small conductance mechanosensitive channel
MEWNWERFYNHLMDWLIVHVPKILLALVVLLIGLWLVKMVSKWLGKIMSRRKFNASLRYFLLNLAAISLQVLVVMFSLQVAGIQLTFFAAIVAGLGVAAGLALSGTLQNFVSGILILVLHPYRVGDMVIIQGQQGTVTSILLFYTTVVTLDNKTIIVPNGKLSNDIVTNLSREGKRRIDFDLKFSYKVDIKQVRQVVDEAVKLVPGVLQDPVLTVGIELLDFDKYTATVRAWTNAADFESTRLLLQEKVLETLRSKQILP